MIYNGDLGSLDTSITTMLIMIGNLYNQNIHYNKEKAISVNHVFSGVSSGGKGLIPKIAHSDPA